MKEIILAIFTAFLLTGCERMPVSGVVVGKRFNPPRTIVTVVSTGNTCVPITIINPTLWLIYIDDSAGERHRRSISRCEYDKIRIGQCIVNDSIVWQ